jgi:hypothetical protein
LKSKAFKARNEDYSYILPEEKLMKLVGACDVGVAERA